ncbi:hypothetical protein [Methylobacterium sp. WSM2598]|uniref:hypothetical protein n=1 Tax=Methylobacterium sp. WSM2598 TaxID=398261 RepID=UPI0003A51381|nr:hypothetical protein [Methylobacterium sp. WSM2598]
MDFLITDCCDPKTRQVKCAKKVILGLKLGGAHLAGSKSSGINVARALFLFSALTANQSEQFAFHPSGPSPTP